MRLIYLITIVPFYVFNVHNNVKTTIQPVAIDGTGRCIGHPVRAKLILGAPFTVVHAVNGGPFMMPTCCGSRTTVRTICAPIRAPTSDIRFHPLGIIMFVVRDFKGRCVNTLGGSLSKKTCGKCAPFLSSLVSRDLAFRCSFTGKRGDVSKVPSMLSNVPVFMRPFFLAPTSVGGMSNVKNRLHGGKCCATFFRNTRGNSVNFRTFSQTANFRSCCKHARCGGSSSFSNH